MSHPALKVENLGKRYRIGLTHTGSLGELANRWSRRLRGQPPDAPKVLDETESSAETDDGATGREKVDKRDFWALRDVSFEIQSGEVVGVIGRNGAGKSTLLKILSQVTAPTTGSVSIAGRVGSLLEVGTGFHPELTGRENVYMNATLLGMRKWEVRAKLDEIVAFSGVEKFLDTPVKRYSSGMTVRLGFAVAAHLEPEVLIVDEVLAVGDASFQRKCLGKMQDVAGEGRTVLFVSHNMAAVRRLCSRVVALNAGQVELDTDPETVVQHYLQTVDDQEAEETVSRKEWNPPHPLCETLALHSVAVEDSRGETPAAFDFEQDLTLRVEFEALRPVPGLRVGMRLRTPDAVELFGSNVTVAPDGEPAKAGRFVVRCVIPGHMLNAGEYLLTCGFDELRFSKRLARLEDVLKVTLIDHRGHGERAEPLPGILRPRLTWQAESLSSDAGPLRKASVSETSVRGLAPALS